VNRDERADAEPDQDDARDQSSDFKEPSHLLASFVSR
jgi:hypothetical protein